MDPRIVAALDTETYFDSELSVRRLGNVPYAIRTDWFLVSLYSPTLDLRYCGPPEEAPWDRVDGQIWISHNAAFDSAIFHAGQQRGQVPSSVAPSRWHCSADLSAYSLLGRALATAVQNAFGVRLPKTVRDKAKGKRWPGDFTPEEQHEFFEYCLADSAWCYQLWEKYAPLWPPEERLFSDLVRMRANQGVTVDRLLLEETIAKLQALKDVAEDQIPWALGDKTVLSLGKVRDYCVQAGIPAPPSLAQGNVACVGWEQQYGTKHPVVGALRQWRKANILLRRCESMQNRLMNEDRVCFGLRYFGAHTGRLSGSDGLNLQNQNRGAFEGIEIRKVLIAAPGKKFVIGDYSQVEPRATCWVTANREMLKLLAEGHNLYESDARLSGVWNGEPGTLKRSDPRLYQTQKAASLGTAYGMGHQRFRQAAKEQLDLDLDPEQCRRIISDWHARHPQVRPYWYELEHQLSLSYARQEDYFIRLPSGRRLAYLDIERVGENGRVRYSAFTSLEKTKRTYLWGGKLFENLIQSLCRDLLRDCVIRLEEAGIATVFTSHDEVCCEVAEDFSAAEILRLMLVPSPWAEGLPLAAEVIETKAYTK